MGKVLQYLDDEKQNILNFGKTQAEDRRNGNAAGTFKHKMYDEWVKYFDNLIATTDRILSTPWDRGDFRQAIKSERHALAQVIDEIDDLIPDYSITTGRQLRTLRQMLRVERRTGNILRKKADNDY